jgi:HTH-type transcriptional regulator / antitoxin HigA
MMPARAHDLAALTPAWIEVQARSPVSLHTISSERHFRGMVKFMNKLLDEVGDQEAHPLMGLLDIVTTFVESYERQHEPLSRTSPSATLRFLMEQHDPKQVDVAPLVGTQSNVSEILSGKRGINARQARALAARFGVSPATFI